MLLGDRREVSAIHNSANTAGTNGGPMPVLDVHIGTKVTSVSAESFSLTAGANSGQLAYSPVMSSLGDRIGRKGDTSLSFSGTLTTEVEWNEGLRASNTLSAGQYAINYETGLVKYNSGSTTSITVSYKTRSASTRLVDRTDTHAPSESSVAASATSTQILAANGSRTGVAIRNDSTVAMYISKGGTASTSSVVKIEPQTLYELPLLANNEVYRGAINAIWESATGFARIEEYV